MSGYTEKHVRMNDYVGAGIYATITWPTACTVKGNRHFLGLLGPSCVKCGQKPEVQYEKDVLVLARTRADK